MNTSAAQRHALPKKTSPFLQLPGQWEIYTICFSSELSERGMMYFPNVFAYRHRSRFSSQWRYRYEKSFQKTFIALSTQSYLHKQK
jgi:hypothetical protein